MANTVDITSDGLFTACKEVLQTKFNDASTLATWAQGVLETNLQALVHRDEQFTVEEYFAAAQSALENIPVMSVPGDIIYTSPSPLPTLTDAGVYIPPTVPAWETVSYVSPASVTPDPLSLTVPTRDSLTALPTPTLHTAGAAPNTAVTFNNADFSDPLYSALQSKLMGDLANSPTGLGDAEAGMFNRAITRENDILDESYRQITTQFSARGFDMPPGAIDALIAQESNKSTIRLTDVNTGIAEMSAKLAQAWNQTTVAASAQVTEVLARVFDSKVMRDFEAAKSNVMMAIETFKAKITEVTTNAQLEGTYLSSVTAQNDGIIRQFTGELSAETARLSATSELNRSRFADRNAEVQALTTEMSSKIEKNKGLSSQFLAEAQGEVTRITAPLEVNKSKVSVYATQVQSNTSEMQAMASTEEAIARVGDINSRRALSLADLASKLALSNIDQAVRKYAIDVETLKTSAQTAAQMISSAIGSVNSGATMGFSGSASTSTGYNIGVAYKAPDGTLPPVIPVPN